MAEIAVVVGGGRIVDGFRSGRFDRSDGWTCDDGRRHCDRRARGVGEGAGATGEERLNIAAEAAPSASAAAIPMATATRRVRERRTFEAATPRSDASIRGRARARAAAAVRSSARGTTAASPRPPADRARDRRSCVLRSAVEPDRELFSTADEARLGRGDAHVHHHGDLGELVAERVGAGRPSRPSPGPSPRGARRRPSASIREPRRPRCRPSSRGPRPAAPRSAPIDRPPSARGAGLERSTRRASRSSRPTSSSCKPRRSAGERGCRRSASNALWTRSS